MVDLIITYYPKKGENNSPVDILLNLCNVKERAHFIEKLELLSSLDSGLWNFKWLDYFNHIFQIRQGDFRLYFDILDNKIVVCHVSLKSTQKAKVEDLNRAAINLQAYRGN